MNKRQKIIVSITGIFIVLLALVGLTYAYFLTQIRGNEETKSISISTANLILEYGDGNSIISVPNIIPGQNIRPKIFTVTNKGNETVENFNIYLENVINQLERKEDLTYTITCSNTTAGAANTTCDDFEVIENEINSEGNLVFPSVMSVVAKDTLAPATEDTPAEVHTYTIKVTYKNEDNIDQSIDMNKQISAKVNIYDGKTKFLATEIMSNISENGTRYVAPSMLGKTTNTTIPGENGLETEKVLSYTFDDLGTTYFYRGTVENNFVNFAGMCWRIVRINGDGSIKLILDDKNTTCDAYDEVDPEIFAGGIIYHYRGDGIIGVGDFGHDLNDKNFMILNYLNPEYTGMAAAFENYQKNELKSYINKMKSGNWCYDDTTYADEYGTTKITDLTPYYNITDKDVGLFYGAYIRNKNKQYSLDCYGTNMNNFYDGTPMYVSTLTLDEVVYAGLGSSGGNSYLASGWYESDAVSWTLSPHTYYFSPPNSEIGWSGDQFVQAFFMGSSGTSYLMINNEFGFRPAISLNSTSTVTTKTDTATNGQPGTIHNPYVIN